MMNESYRRERGDFTDDNKYERTADDQVRFFGSLSEFGKWRKRHDVSALGTTSVATSKSKRASKKDHKGTPGSDANPS